MKSRVKKPSKAEKNQLITAIQNLLQKGFVQTQEDIRLALEKQELQVNQAMISRVLHKLGAIKVVENDQIVYRLPTELLNISTSHSLDQLVLNITHNEALIVIRTVPGSAQLVARLLDHQKEIGILGTVAGDDTIFIAPESTKNMEKILERVSEVLFRT